MKEPAKTKAKLKGKTRGDAMRQEEKEFLSLAGEFAVASELNRRPHHRLDCVSALS
jgi:hypothetical protein